MMPQKMGKELDFDLQVFSERKNKLDFSDLLAIPLSSESVKALHLAGFYPLESQFLITEPKAGNYLMQVAEFPDPRVPGKVESLIVYGISHPDFFGKKLPCLNRLGEVENILWDILFKELYASKALAKSCDIGKLRYISAYPFPNAFLPNAYSEKSESVSPLGQEEAVNAPIEKQPSFMDGEFALFARAFGINYVTLEGGHIVSPDVGMAFALDRLLLLGKITEDDRILEIGAGVSPIRSLLERRNIKVQRITTIERSSNVCRFLKEHFFNNQGEMIQKDVLTCDKKFWQELAKDKPYSLILLGIPYELVPVFMQNQGKSLSDLLDKNKGTLINQIASPGFFEFHLDWVFPEDPNMMKKWTAWKPSQTLPFHFPKFYKSNNLISYEYVQTLSSDKEMVKIVESLEGQSMQSLRII